MKFPFFGNKQVPNMGGGVMPQGSPFQNMQQIMQNINAIRQNPGQLGSFLYEKQIISKQQLDEMNQLGISGNPEAIGNYMMQRGFFNQQQAQDVYNSSALPIQNSLRQN